MQKMTPTDGQSLNVVDENIAVLKKAFPEAFTEDGIDFEVLRQLLGDKVADGEEKYGLNWFGKKKARQIALTPSMGTLRPCPEESVGWDNAQNLFLEGDNLEVLKLLQKNYSGKFKLIYIDPPYNTGNDFVYPDKYNDNLGTYLIYTNQKNEEGLAFSTNTESSGRFHTNWLNMIYPRLKVARNLLASDGLIAISIDNNEISSLEKCCCEIFGEENILSIISNVNNPKGRSDDKFFATAHEYIVFVAKDINQVRTFGFEPEEHITRRYNKVDENGKRYREIDLRKTGDADRREDRPDMFYYFYYDRDNNELITSKDKVNHPNKIEIFPIREDGVEGRWRWGFETATNRTNELIAREMPNRGIWGIFQKDYLEGRPPVKPTTAWTNKDVNSERGSEQFCELGFNKEVFPRPKPLGTLKRILEVGTLPDEENLFLDFFCGSGTSAQAATELSIAGKRNISWVMVQLPEQLKKENKAQKAAYDYCISMDLPPTIAEIAKERIKKTFQIYKESEVEKINKFCGVKVFKLDSSNIVAWNPDKTDLEQTLMGHTEHLVPGRSELDVLYELLLKRGVELTAPIEEKEIAGKKVYSIGFGVLFACLDKKIQRDQIEELAHGIIDWHKELDPISDTQVVFRDSAFENDVTKANMTAILEQNGIKHVRSL